MRCDTSSWRKTDSYTSCGICSKNLAGRGGLGLPFQAFGFLERSSSQGVLTRVGAPSKYESRVIALWGVAGDEAPSEGRREKIESEDEVRREKVEDSVEVEARGLWVLTTSEPLLQGRGMSSL